jgi:heparanase 1
MTVRAFVAIAAMGLLSNTASAATPPAGLGTLKAIGKVDPRFLSYNIEMVEVTGGRFWRPYGSPGTERYEYRGPIDLANRRLRAFAKALAPAYVRFSGTWANATYFSDTEEAPAKAPDGFDTILTRKQWRGAVDFARATGGAIVTSVATSPGTHDGQGLWQSDTAARWFAFTKAIGGSIAASEFANEPNMLTLTKPPAGYTGADYRRDYARFAGWLKQSSPKTLLLAPGFAELGEPTRSLSLKNKSIQQLSGAELLTVQLPKPDAFSFHFYGGGSERCGGKFLGHSMEKALSPAWLESVDPAIARMKALRDETAPGAPLWDTETGETACGGNPWASAFADTFRFVDTLGRSARQGVQVVIHNTLAASDYALIDGRTLMPHPDFWAAVLWKRTMGATVLESPSPSGPVVRVYAHCLVGRAGGVGLAVLNTGATAETFNLSATGLAWVLQAPTLDSQDMTINGVAPRVDDNGDLSGLKGVAVKGPLALPPKTITFISVPAAGDGVCR